MLQVEKKIIIIRLKNQVNVNVPDLSFGHFYAKAEFFRKPVQIARQGDRVGMCVAQLDASEIERGLACTPNSMKTCETVLAAVQKIKFFLDPLMTKTKLHITLGHQTAIGLVHFFSMELNEADENTLNFQGNFKETKAL